MAHKPQSTTDRIATLSFADALARETEPCGYDRKKWIYVPDTYEEYRYLLGTVGTKPLVCIGINPSTAHPDHLDNTLKSVERIAHANGYDSFIMVNVYAQRATDPKDMEKVCNLALHQENCAGLRYALERTSSGTPAIWAAWGAIIKTRPYLFDCVEDMIRVGGEYGAQWFTAGTRSKNGGHPHHPLYLRRDTPLDPFDPAAYVRENRG